MFVYSRTGGTALATFDINNLARTSAGWAVKDPKVVFDPFSSRFILAVVQYNTARSGCTNAGSQIEVVASNADPTTAWQTPRTFNNLGSLGGATPVALNVSLGMTSTVVALAWDYASCLTGNAVASQTDIVQRADLATGTLGVNSARAFTPGPLGAQPAMALGLSTVEYEIANDSNCTGTATNQYEVFTYSGTPDAKNVAGPTCAANGTEGSGSSAPPAAPQNGTSTTLQTGDDRFLDAVWVNNMLWAAGGTGCTPSGDSQVRSCVNVVSATATSAGSVSAATQLTPEGLYSAYLYYPSLALDSSGNAILTFDSSSSSALESMQLASINGGAWSSLTTLHTSADYYAPSGCLSPCSWGAYSGAVQDPLHPTDVWIVSADNDGNSGTSCATVNTCWNTYIARYTFAAPSISSLTPSSGSGVGGQVVTVAGSDFAAGTTVTFAGSPIAIANLTPNSFTFTTPPQPPGHSVVYAVATDTLGSSVENTASSYLYVPLANYVPVNPFRILDTRPNSPLGPNTTRTIHVTGLGSPPIPTTAVAAVLNVTAVAGTATSLLAVYPAGTVKPGVSDLNFTARSVTPNLVTVTLGSGGEVTIFNSLGTVNVLADVEGYFAPPASPTPAGEFHPIAPTRVCDTRLASYACHGAIGGGTARRVTVAQGTIPNTGAAAAAVLNLTAVAGTAATYLSVYPTSSNGSCPVTSATGLPGVSTINMIPGAVEANRVMVELGPAATGGPDTSVCVYNAAGSINVVLDGNGWYGGATATTGYQYQAIVPSRICDTRLSATSCSPGAIGAGASRLVGVAGKGGVPTIASGTVVQAVIANLTGIAPTASTYLVGYSAALTRAPGSSDINLSVGAVRPNLIVVQLDTTAGSNDGFMELFNAAGSVNAAVDVEGWFQ